MKALITFISSTLFFVIFSLLTRYIPFFASMQVFTMLVLHITFVVFCISKYDDYAATLKQKYETEGRSLVPAFRMLCYNWIQKSFISALWIVAPLYNISPIGDSKIFTIACCLLVCLTFSGAPIRFLFAFLSPLLMIPSFLSLIHSTTFAFYSNCFFSMWFIVYSQFLIMWINIKRGRYATDPSTNMTYIVSSN